MAYATEIDVAVAARYGNRFLVDEAPQRDLPEVGMPAQQAMRLVAEELTPSSVSAGGGRSHGGCRQLLAAFATPSGGCLEEFSDRRPRAAQA